MRRLLFVSVVWGISFGLLKHHLAGVDPDLINASRMAFALVVFLPWLARKAPPLRVVAELVCIGAIQFGLMYTLYNRSFAILQGHQVALATLLTPVYVTLVDDLLARRVRWRFFASALLSVGGAALSIGAGQMEGALHGLLLLQAANLCFAVGQVAYRRTLARYAGTPNAVAMAWAYVGGMAVVMVAASQRLSGLQDLTRTHWLTLAWLGLVASGLCFFLWNGGGRTVNTGVLAVMNDLKIPFGVLASLLIFAEAVHWPRLLVGGSVVIFAWWLASRVPEEDSKEAALIVAPGDG